ncbi:hypothetical protein FA95DRAFT_1612260 [Auriscalpium vulgare]|uniref:Uncharacterized protein n=1 Tax=Auriscalpium vulgare TaxID=40419 RepID=A0ACB8R8D1_9AGAM|nr:hypothetical protein FA95DRAFT_1612260 [Auriscalpium vulgare]
MSILKFAPLRDVTGESIHQKSVSELAYIGTPAYHLTDMSFFFRVAQIILGRPFRRLRSVGWWWPRVGTCTGRSLDEPIFAPAPSSLSSLEKFADAYTSNQDLFLAQLVLRAACKRPEREDAWPKKSRDAGAATASNVPLALNDNTAQPGRVHASSNPAVSDSLLG